MYSYYETTDLSINGSFLYEEFHAHWGYISFQAKMSICATERSVHVSTQTILPGFLLNIYFSLPSYLNVVESIWVHISFLKKANTLRKYEKISRKWTEVSFVLCIKCPLCSCCKLIMADARGIKFFLWHEAVRQAGKQADEPTSGDKEQT